jgi:hypothetical protein
MVDITDPRNLKRDIEQEAYRYYEQLSGVPLARRQDGSFQSQGHNDEIDAFRHAYTSGRVTQVALGQQWLARRFGNDAEIGAAHPNDPYEHRMDLWNNEAGRRIGDRTSGSDALAREVFAELQRGGLVTGLADDRLRQLFPDDPRLRLPVGNPQRDLVDQQDVDRINRDVGRVQDQSREVFPKQHPDRAYFDALRGQLPATVSDTKVAEALLAAKTAGIERVDQFGSAMLRDGQIFMIGKTPGFHARLDADAPAPDMRQSVYQTDQHNLTRAYENQAQSQPPQTQTYSPAR